MSGIRAVDLGLLMPDGDDPAPVRQRALSYDFSRWNCPGESDIRESEPDNAGAEAEEQGPVSFKVYTPAEIKLAPMPVRRTPPPPPPDDGIKDVHEALEIAKSLGPKGLLARFGVGVAAGALMLVALIGFAFLADDTPEARGILSARTDTPSAMTDLVPAPPEYTVIGDAVSDVTDSTYFELPDTAPAKAAKHGHHASKATAKRPIVRVSPF
jgi:hypothetical protein